MSETKPLPVRITEVMWNRLQIAVDRTGLKDRTAVIKVCLILFLDYLETNNYHLPVDVDKLIRQGDGRYKESRYDKEEIPVLQLTAENKTLHRVNKRKVNGK